MHLPCRQKNRNLVELYKRDIITIEYSDNEIVTIREIIKNAFCVDKGRVNRWI